MVIDLENATEQIQDLVAKAQSGEEVIFARDGQRVASVAPDALVHRAPMIVTEEQRRKALEALEGIRKLSEELNLGPFDYEEFKRDKEFGRR